MLSSDGDGDDFASTCEREIAFATHHAIHHNAMIRVSLTAAGLSLPKDFGMAPSTSNFLNSAQQQQRQQEGSDR